ncbi:TPA: hypothetical protein ACG3KG_000997 [Clostridioides difficile]|nr:hypothetical protein RHN74_11865 [Clostridioides difficile]
MSNQNILDFLTLENKLSDKEIISLLGWKNRGKVTDIRRGKSNFTIDDVLIISEKFHVSVDYILKGKEPSTDILKISNSTDNEQEILSLLHKFDERNQIKFISKVEDLADKMLEKENDIE